jgi:hypothetical protein
VGAESVHKVGGEGDRATTAVRLGGAEGRPSAAYLVRGLLDAEPSVVEVAVSPAQPEQLAHPQAGVEVQRDRHVEVGAPRGVGSGPKVLVWPTPRLWRSRNRPMAVVIVPTLNTPDRPHWT